MLNRLNIKLLLPGALVGIIFILALSFFAQKLNQTTLIITLITMLVLQLLSGYLYSQQFLA